MWKTVKLDDIFNFKNGRSFKKTEWKENGLPIIRIQNLNNTNAPFNYFEGDYDSSIEVNNGDLLFSWSGTVGTSFGAHIWERDKGVLNQHIFKLTKKREIDTRYAFYCLKHITKLIEQSVVGAVGIRHVTKKNLVEFEIPLPPLEEQERIVAKLDAAFAEIDRAAEWAQTKENKIQKLKASLLNISLSSDAVTSETLKLGDLCDVITKGTTPTSIGFKFESDGINFIKVESLTSNNGFIPSKFAKISTNCNESLKRSQLQKGDILFSIAGALGRTAVVTKDILPANTNQALAIIRLKSNIEIDTGFLLYLLNSDTIRVQSERNKGGVAQQNLSLTQLKNYDVYLPSFTEQQQIVARLDAAFAELENANEAIKKLKLNYSSLKAAILTKELQSSEAA